MAHSTRRKDSMILTLSRRIDRASGVVSFSIVAASIVFAFICGAFVIVPGIGEEELLREKLVEHHSRSEDLRSEVREMEDMLNALSDGYGVRRIAIERYGYQPTQEPLG